MFQQNFQSNQYQYDTPDQFSFAFIFDTEMVTDKYTDYGKQKGRYSDDNHSDPNIHI